MELIAAQREFTAYGPSHLAVLGLFAIGAVLLVWIGRRQTESQARILGRYPGGSDPGGVHRGARLQTDPARPRHVGTAAAVRRRRTHGGLCVVVRSGIGPFVLTYYCVSC